MSRYFLLFVDLCTMLNLLGSPLIRLTFVRSGVLIIDITKELYYKNCTVLISLTLT